MSETFKLGINWTRSAFALALLCAVFSFSARAQSNPNKPLNENEVKIFMAAAKKNMETMFTYLSWGRTEPLFEKWDARDDLVGKTQAQIIELLRSDYELVHKKDIEESLKVATLGNGPDGPWEAGHMSEFRLESFVEPADTPAKPADTPAEPEKNPKKPDYLDESKDNPNQMLRFMLVNLPLDADAKALVFGEDSRANALKLLITYFYSKPSKTKGFDIFSPDVN